jgi:NitT/TauT family transport system permease protein
VLFSIFSYRYRWFEELLAPPVQTIKATPVASFVILTLVWIAPQNLSVFISFLMVFPIMYTNVLMGIRSTDKKLLEMATVFRVPAYRRIRYIYLSQVLPFFRSACSVALGLSWKAGIAAEVIGLPQGSIGEMLYQAKLYLDTPDMFAWTLVIIVISVWFEKIFLILLDKAMLKMEHL